MKTYNKIVDKLDFTSYIVILFVLHSIGVIITYL
jgi:hypothetical protein